MINETETPSCHAALIVGEVGDFTGALNNLQALRMGIYLSMLTDPVINAVAFPDPSTGRAAILAVPLAFDFKTRLSFVVNVLPVAIVSVPVKVSVSARLTLLLMIRSLMILFANNPDVMVWAVEPLNSIAPFDVVKVPLLEADPEIFKVAPDTVKLDVLSMVRLLTSQPLPLQGATKLLEQYIGADNSRLHIESSSYRQVS